MKKITLLILFLFSIGEMNAQIWTINSCSNLGSTVYGPMNSTTTANANSRKAVIYPASQLATLFGQNLNGIYFQRNTATGTMAGTPNFKVYLKEVTATDWGTSAIDWATVTTGATLVYDSNPASTVGSSAGWKLFPLSVNFLYSGTQNLAVFMEYSNTTASSSISWNYEYTSPCSTTTNSNTTKYNNNTTGTLSASLASTDYRRPLIGFDYVVSCNAPSIVATSNITSIGTDISWIENAIQPQNGYEYINSTTNTAPTPTATPTGTSATGVVTTSLSGLTPATTYYFWVRGNCGASDKSIWVGPLTYTTLCVDVVQFVENFDSSPTGTGNLPICWEKAGTSTNTYTTTGSLSPMSPSNRLYMNISTTTTSFALLPTVSNLQANSHRLKFKAYCTTTGKELRVGYFAIQNNPNSFVSLNQFLLPGTTVATTVEFTLYPTSIPVGINRLVFNLVDGVATTVYIDDVKWEAIPTCPEPTGLNTGLITSNSANIGWTENGSATAWEIQYGTAGFVLGAGTVISATTNPFMLTSLTSNTSYDVYVRSVCSTTDSSSWSGPLTFKTLCDNVASFIEPFDTYPTGATSLPDCWSKVGTGNVYITSGGAAPMSPANRLYMNVGTTTTAHAVMRPVSNLQANTHRLKFKTYCTTANKILSIGYFTTPGDASSYVQIDAIPLPSTLLASTQEFTIIPTTVPTGVSQLVFKIDQTTPASTTLYIDDVKWEVNSSCVEPTVLTASAITNSGATLGWTNGGIETIWDIQYGLTGFALGTGTTVTGVTTNPYLLNGLVASTQYQFYVRAVCSGPENSPWSSPFTFKTQCNDFTDYIQNFEGYATGTTSPMPDCWSKLGTGSTYITTGSTTPMSPANRLYMFASGTASTEGFAVLPSVSNLQANTHRLKFKAFATTLNKFMVVGYLTDPSDLNTFVQLEEITLPGTTVATTQEYTVTPGVLPVGVKHLCIKNPGYPASTTTFYVDDVVWEPIPACVEPNFLVSSMITNNSATLGWTEGATATAWEIEYGPTGFTLGSGTVVSAGTNPFVLSGLTSNSTYSFYVRAVCSTTSSSAWTGPSTFKTQCNDVTEYSENFDSYATGSTNPLADCWSKGGTGSVYLTTGAVSPMSPTNRLYMFASGTANPPTESYAILPAVSNLQANTHRLRFKGYATLANRILQVGYLTDPSNVNTFVLLQSITLASTVVANTQEYVVVPTGVPAGVKHLAIKNPGFTASSATLYLDDFAWELLPSVAPSCTTNIVATPDAACGNFANTITWNASPVTDGYRLTIGTTSGGNNILNNTDIGNVTSYSFVGNFNTTYYYKVVPFNSVGDATGCTEQTFTTFVTGCYCSPIYTTGASSGDLISNIVITGTTLSNNSGTTPTNPYYTYFTGQPNYTATLQPGVTYDMVVSNGTFSGQHMAVWIDLNDDLTFDASEKMGFTTVAIAGSGSATIQIPISCSAPSGLHRMRVRDVWNTVGSAIDACASYGYGEAEDYDITIGSITAPTGNATQTVSVTNAADATIEDLVVSPTVITWYPTQTDAIGGTNALTVGTQLVDNTIYYAVNVENGCTSTPFAVTVTVVLSNDEFNNNSFVVYPNPVKDVLNLSYSTEITSIQVMNLLGQEVISKNVGASSTQLDMSKLSVGTYIIKVIIDDISKVIKVVKQ